MMLFDRKISISIGANRKSTNWQNLTLKYSDFIEKLKTPVRTDESYAEYMKLPKAKQNELKDVGGFVGGELIGNRRKANNVKSRDLISLDFDNILSGNLEMIIKRVSALGCGYVIYSTRKHSTYKPRLRIIIPADRPMSVDEYEPVARKLAELIGIEMADPTTFEPSRLMYWPSCSKDGEFVFQYEDKNFISVDGVLGLYTDWKDISSWPQVPGHSTRIKKDLIKQEDPTTKRGIVGAFCRTYDIYSAIDKFIPGAYSEAIDGRLTYLEGSTIGGAVIYQDGLFLYSHHATDPCSGQLVNAWDLVRLHKFSGLDEEAEPETPVVTLPSYKAMKSLAIKDKEVEKLLATERQEESKDFFDVLGQPGVNTPPPNSVEQSSTETKGLDDWRDLLKRDNNGNYEKSIANIVTVLTFDGNYKGRIFVDEFANRGMVECPLPWDNSDEVRIWNDYDDAQLTLRLEKEYNLTGKDKIENAIKVVGFNNRKNAVKDYLTGLTWDGVNRIDTLLSDYLGAEQSVYTAAVMRKSLSAAVARAISNTGVKFDNMVVFTGKQGIGKSTFLAKLGMNWFSDSLYNFEGKEAAELIQGTLINEVGELSALNKSETEAVKQFLSKTHDIYREAYGRRTNKYPRRCVFYGSTNSDSFLRDATGNRRFWPVSVGICPTKKDIFKDLTCDVINQIWAQAYWLFVCGEPLYLSEEENKIAVEMQESYREVDFWESEIAAYLDRPIPPNWFDMSVVEQRAFMSRNLSYDGELIEREHTCIKELWAVCFNGDSKYCGRRESIRLSNAIKNIPRWTNTNKAKKFGKYGTQKCYYKTKILTFNKKSVQK